MEKKITNNFKIRITLFCITVIFILLNSIGTIINADSNDSFIFNTIGKFWNEGKIPYIDLFDYKGPIILLQ